MPSHNNWRFTLDEDFVDSDGNPYEYADDGKQEWGDELKRLPFVSGPSSAAINHDHTVLAVAVGHEIHLFKAASLSFKEIGRLKGHNSRVDHIAFQPGHPNTLLSCAQNDHCHSVRTEPTIIFWNLASLDKRAQISDDEVQRIAVNAAETLAQGLTGLGLQLDEENKSELGKTLELATEHSITQADAAHQQKLHGRLIHNFGSQVFSPSGKYLTYLPGMRLRSNGDHPSDIKIYSMGDSRDLLTLSAQRDNIVWTGYDKYEKLIGTVAWDKTSCIWDASTGELKFTFYSEGQNWTGAFSPDSQRFVTTCGGGTISVYSLDDGSQVCKFRDGAGWYRTLAWSGSHKNWLAVGGRNSGELLLLDVARQEIIQRRILGTGRAEAISRARRLHGVEYSVINVQFVHNGRKLIFFTRGDGSAEVYDLEGPNRKWRLARTGTNSYPSDPSSVQNGEAEPQSKPGKGIEVWENASGVFIATVDGDAVRIWQLFSN